MLSFLDSIGYGDWILHALLWLPLVGMGLVLVGPAGPGEARRLRLEPGPPRSEPRPLVGFRSRGRHLPVRELRSPGSPVGG